MIRLDWLFSTLKEFSKNFERHSNNVYSGYMIYHSSQSDDKLWYKILPEKEEKQPKTPPKTKFFLIYNGLNKKYQIKNAENFSITTGALKETHKIGILRTSFWGLLWLASKNVEEARVEISHFYVSVLPQLPMNCVNCLRSEFPSKKNL